MQKKWLKYTVAAVVVLAVGFLFLRARSGKADLAERAAEVLTAIAENTSLPEAEEGLAAGSGSESLQVSTADRPQAQSEDAAPQYEQLAIAEDGWYTKKDDVALYIHTYKRLPGNFITKKQAQDLGWTGGGLDSYAKGKSIGGDVFGNYEGLLPKKSGRKYTECDIDTKGKKSRGAKRIVFSNDGLIFYTEDHYKSFELLYEGDAD